MPTVKVRNLKNEEVGDLELPDAVFGVELNEGLIHAAVKSFLASRRQGTVGTKTRGNVSGSGRKLWKQKGTGRARIASIRSPLWKGGGKVHGPQPRDWSTTMPKKMRRGALRSALSERVREGNLIVLDALGFEQPKTKQFTGAMSALGISGKTLIVETGENENLILSSRNIQNVKVVGSNSLNIYDVLRNEKLVMSRGAVEDLARTLDAHQKNETDGDERDDSERDDSERNDSERDDSGAQQAEEAA